MTSPVYRTPGRNAGSTEVDNFGAAVDPFPPATGLCKGYVAGGFEAVALVCRCGDDVWAAAFYRNFVERGFWGEIGIESLLVLGGCRLRRLGYDGGRGEVEDDGVEQDPAFIV